MFLPVNRKAPERKCVSGSWFSVWLGASRFAFVCGTARDRIRAPAVKASSGQCRTWRETSLITVHRKFDRVLQDVSVPISVSVAVAMASVMLTGLSRQKRGPGIIGRHRRRLAPALVRTAWPAGCRDRASGRRSAGSPAAAGGRLRTVNDGAEDGILSAGRTLPGQSNA